MWLSSTERYGGGVAASAAPPEIAIIAQMRPFTAIKIQNICRLATFSVCISG
jgi:hypothetical protein